MNWPRFTEDVTIVSTVTPDYQHLFNAALESVAMQTVVPRMVVVQYGDPSDWQLWGDRCTNVAANPDPSKFVLSRARNEGIAFARTPYVICLDADDLLEPTFVERHLELAAPDTFVTCGFRIMGQTEHHLSPLFTDFSLPAFLEGNKAIVSTMFPRSAWEKLGGFAGWWGTNYCDDYLFWVKAAASGYPFRMVRDHLLIYRDNAAGLSVEFRRSQQHETMMSELRATFTPGGIDG